jgi:hypothetical protein
VWGVSGGRTVLTLDPATEELFGSVRVWALDITQLVELARSRLTRSLTDEECRQYRHMPACPPTD